MAEFVKQYDEKGEAYVALTLASGTADAAPAYSVDRLIDALEFLAKSGGYVRLAESTAIALNDDQLRRLKVTGLCSGIRALNANRSGQKVSTLSRATAATAPIQLCIKDAETPVTVYGVVVDCGSNTVENQWAAVRVENAADVTLEQVAVKRAAKGVCIVARGHCPRLKLRNCGVTSRDTAFIFGVTPGLSSTLPAEVVNAHKEPGVHGVVIEGIRETGVQPDKELYKSGAELYTYKEGTYPTDVTVEGLYAVGVYYGLNANGVRGLTVSNSRFYHVVRGMSIQHRSSAVVIDKCSISDPVSAGVHLAYGVRDVQVVGAVCSYYVNARGEAGFQAYIDCHDVTFSRCRYERAASGTAIPDITKHGLQYGFYTAIDCSGIVFEGCTATGGFQKAAFAAESQWLPTTAGTPAATANYVNHRMVGKPAEAAEEVFMAKGDTVGVVWRNCTASGYNTTVQNTIDGKHPDAVGFWMLGRPGSRSEQRRELHITHFNLAVSLPALGRGMYAALGSVGDGVRIYS